MKKSRNIIVILLALVTTVSVAQDLNFDSRTRVDMSGDGDKMSTVQRVTVGTNWGSDNWGIVLSSDINYATLDAEEVSAEVYEAYATTDLFGFASMNIGRQALSYGSGVFMGINDWAANRNTADGMTFAINNDMIDLDFGINNNDKGEGIDALQHYWLNTSKSSEYWKLNLFFSHYSSNTNEGIALYDGTQGGLDFKYSVMNGSLDLNASYNAVRFNDIQGDLFGVTFPNETEYEFEMMDLSATYKINTNLNLTAGIISVGEDGFYTNGNGNIGNYETNSWLSHGNIGHLGANQENLYLKGSYDMGKVKITATNHSVSNNKDQNYERSATDIAVEYSLNDNTSLAYRMITDNNGGNTDSNYNWITLTVTP